MDAKVCINDGAAARVACTGCGKPFCDRCLPFVVDDRLWCEPCGNRVEDAIRPQWVSGLLLGGGIFGASTLLFAVIFVGLGRIYFAPVIAMWVLAGVVGWNRVSPIRGGEKPRVQRRG